MDSLRFEDPFRPIYEKYSIATWSASGLLSFGFTLFSPYQSTVFYLFTAFCISMAAWRALPAMKLYRVHKSMRGSQLTFMTRAELKALCDKKPGHLFLGYGFGWSQSQTQAAYTLTRHDPDKLVPRESEETMGHAWIHGIGVLEEEPIYMPVEHARTHTLIVGTTGAGKTRAFDALIAQTIALGYAVIIIDPKGDRDMCDAARIACNELGRPNDFVYVHPAYPELSTRMDPLKNFNRTTELASRIASLIQSESSSDPFTNFSQMAVNKLCDGLVFVDDRPSLVLLRRLLEGGITTLMIAVFEKHFEKCLPGYDANGRETGWRTGVKEFVNKQKDKGDEGKALGYCEFYRARILGTWPNGIVEGLMGSFEHDSTHFGKMVTSLMPVLNMLTSGPMGGLLSPDYDDPNDPRPITDFGKITRAGQVAYLGLDSLSDAMVASAIGSLFLSDLTAVAGDRYNFGEGSKQVPIALFVDECAEVMNAPLVQLLNKGRGSGFSCFLATQTIADISDRLGSKELAMKTLGNINNVIALRCNDPDTQAFITESMPEVTVRKVKVGQSAANEVANPLTFRGTISESLDEETVPLLPPQLFNCFPNLEGVARVSAGRVVKLRYPILRAGAGAA